MVDQRLYFSQYATNLVQTSIRNSLSIVENTTALAKDILKEAVNSPCVSESKLQEMEAYSEQLSIQILSQCISANIYASKVTQNIIVSVMDAIKNDSSVLINKKQAVSNDEIDEDCYPVSMELNNFVDAISSNIFYDAAKDLIKCSRLDDFPEDYSCFQSAVHNRYTPDPMLYNSNCHNHCFSNHCYSSDSSTPETVSSNPQISLDAAEKYASVILQNLHTSSETDSDVSSLTNSTPSGLLTVNQARRESLDTSSEAVTPHSAAEDSWKRGLYHFADQLLYSLSFLEDDENANKSFIDDFDSSQYPASNFPFPRVRRSDSCPHISWRNTNNLKEAILARRRQSETIAVHSRRRRSECVSTVESYAERLAAQILS